MPTADVTAGPAGDPASRTVADLGEFGLIRRIVATGAASGRSGSPVVVGPGDDAAVLSTGGDVVMCTDVLVEGRHFIRDWVPAMDVGRRAVAANMADVAAMGARTTAVVAAAVLPDDLAVDWVDDLVRGLRAEAARCGADLVGGDLSAGPLVVLTVTALGDLAGAAPVLRSGARPGEVLVLAGTVGRSAAGLDLLRRGLAQSAPDLVAAYRCPQPPYSAGPVLAALGATAMIDVSDGLLADAGHLAEASGVSVHLLPSADWGASWLDRLIEVAADHTELDRWVMTGGEDHGLLASVPESAARAARAAGFLVVGAVRPGEGVWVRGTRYEPVGHDHFRPPAAPQGGTP